MPNGRESIQESVLQPISRSVGVGVIEDLTFLKDFEEVESARSLCDYRDTRSRPVSVRLSVCLSRSCIVSKRLKMSSIFSTWLPIISFQFPEAVWCYPFLKGTPQWGGGVKCTGVGIFATVYRNRRWFRTQYEIGPWLLSITDRKS